MLIKVVSYWFPGDRIVLNFIHFFFSESRLALIRKWILARLTVLLRDHKQKQTNKKRISLPTRLARFKMSDKNLSPRGFSFGSNEVEPWSGDNELRGSQERRRKPLVSNPFNLTFMQTSGSWSDPKVYLHNHANRMRWKENPLRPGYMYRNSTFRLPWAAGDQKFLLISVLLVDPERNCEQSIRKFYNLFSGALQCPDKEPRVKIK